MNDEQRHALSAAVARRSAGGRLRPGSPGWQSFKWADTEGDLGALSGHLGASVIHLRATMIGDNGLPVIVYHSLSADMAEAIRDNLTRLIAHARPTR